jgi:putative transposase
MRYVRISSLRRFNVKKWASEEQIIRILKDADRGETTSGEVCRSHGVSEHTFYRWRRQYAGLSTPEVRRRHELEKEHARLKRIMAERDLEIDARKELLAKKF